MVRAVAVTVVVDLDAAVVCPAAFICYCFGITTALLSTIFFHYLFPTPRPPLFASLIISTCKRERKNMLKLHYTSTND